VTSRTIVQRDRLRVPTAAARFRAWVRPCGICGGQRGTRAGFLRVLRFPLQILIPPTAPHPSSIVRGWYYRPVSGQRTKWTQSEPTSTTTTTRQGSTPRQYKSVGREAGNNVSCGSLTLITPILVLEAASEPPVTGPTFTGLVVREQFAEK
jgi:hypothetical protein